MQLRKRPIIALGLVLAFTAAACGSSDNGGTVNTSASNTSTTAQSLLSSLPAAIQQSKEIKVGSDIAYPPVESFKEGTQTPQGIDVDVASALGEKLGVSSPSKTRRSMASSLASRPSASTSSCPP